MEEFRQALVSGKSGWAVLPMGMLMRFSAMFNEGLFGLVSAFYYS